ncbi:ATP-binding protein [Leptolyngbya sp. FACHB-261]|uniref:ATP-binding protein n=1 Tax=Leptolyngbya sp. FACHB-261 TaxID=2692806 RepID=UPI0016829699|nr:ATP-binding protein [Leptolyngbya sp. FACHB-261]MBD2102627.1 ATP-binding protein [Leptolyngbya sp. FACHB-261]
MAFREELYAQLIQLPPGQFEEILFRLNIEVWYRRRQAVSQEQRAIDIISYLEHEEQGFGHLREILDGLLFFREFLPEGAYPVGQSLWQREEAYQRQALEAATKRGEDPEAQRITPEKFYAAQHQAGWLGCFRGWDIRRSFSSELLHQVLNAGHHNCPAAAILGPTGSGKTVALRRLALDLYEQGYKVWWVQDPERLLRFGLAELTKGEAPQFLLVDNIQKLENEDVRRLQQGLRRRTDLGLVVAGRQLPPALQAKVSASSGLFTAESSADWVAIVQKAAELVPTWARAARTLTTAPLVAPNLVHLLWVLAAGRPVANAAQDPAAQDFTAQDLERAFLEILADRVRRIRTILPDLAEAISDAAAIREVGRHISYHSFRLLADYHAALSGPSRSLQEPLSALAWSLLAPLLCFEPEYDAVRFQHQSLAEGLILAGQQGLLGPRPIGTDTWRRATLDLMIKRGSSFSSSHALSGFVRTHPDLISQSQAIAYIQQLLASSNGHGAYLRLIVNERLALTPAQRLELLRAAAPLAPVNAQLWSAVWSWVQHNYEELEQKVELLTQLYQAGCRDRNILLPLLQGLGNQQAQALAQTWLADTTIHPAVLCRCLDLLGEAAQDRARQLLADVTTHPTVLCRCLDLLGETAQDRARQLLADPAMRPDVLCRCLDLLGKTALLEAKQLLTDPATHPFVLCRCLDLLGETALDSARQLLADPATHPFVLCCCLDLLGDARDEARQLLRSSQDSVVLCRCLDLLGEAAQDEAKQLLSSRQDRAVLCRCLKLLGESAQEFALERIRDWTRTDPQVLVVCLEIAGTTAEAQELAIAMLSVWDKNLPLVLRAPALAIPTDTPLRRQRALRILNDWHRQYRPLVTAALNALWDEPALVFEYCQAIVSRWHREIMYRRKHRLPEYDGHLVLALSHPGLHREARKAAQAMLAAEQRSPGLLSLELQQSLVANL